MTLSLEPTSFESDTQAYEVKETSHAYCHGCPLNDHCVEHQIYCEALINLADLHSRLRTAKNLIHFVLSSQGLD